METELLTRVQLQRIQSMASWRGARLETKYVGGHVWHLWIHAHGHIGTNLGAELWWEA